MKADPLDYRYDIALEDVAEFAALPMQERQRIAGLLSLLRDVAGSHFARSRSQTIRLIAGRASMSPSRLQTAWTRYTKAGDWRSLIDGRIRKASAH